MRMTIVSLGTQTIRGAGGLCGRVERRVHRNGLSSACQRAVGRHDCDYAVDNQRGRF